MNALKEFVVNYWLLIVVAVAAGTIVYRYVSSKLKGVSSDNMLNSIIEIVKGEFMNSTDAIETLVKAEKEGGFDKAKEVLAIQLTSFISNSAVLTEAEKTFIKSISVDYIVSELMKEFDNIKDFIDSFTKKKDEPVIEPATVPDTPVVDNTKTDVTQGAVIDKPVDNGNAQ